MLTGLLYNKPDDHLQFLGDCINSAKKISNLKWDTFLDHNKNPLPAIPRTTDGPIRSESFGLSDEPVFPTFETEPVIEMKIQTKLPAIRKDSEHEAESIDIIDDQTVNETLVKDKSEEPVKENLFKNQNVIFVLGKVIITGIAQFSQMVQHICSCCLLFVTPLLCVVIFRWARVREGNTMCKDCGTFWTRASFSWRTFERRSHQKLRKSCFDC